MKPALLLAFASLLSIAKAQSQSWVTPAVRAPRVAHHTFESMAARTQVSFHAYTPEVYELEKERRFPVL
jgi:hypothetical protein